MNPTDARQDVIISARTVLLTLPSADFQAESTARSSSLGSPNVILEIVKSRDNFLNDNFGRGDSC
jgi:hypothetical protein